MKESVLIISPHLDDEVLGCASFLEKDRSVTVLYVTTFHPLFPDGENLKENVKLVRETGLFPRYLDTREKTNGLDLLGQAALIDRFEKTLNIEKPHTVLIPNPSYNQDHRTIYEAALTAMRAHDRNHFVRRILLYEQPETWGTMRKPDSFNPTYYREVDLAKKLKLVSIYKSQQRGHRSLSHISAIGVFRGMQCNMEYAEAFEVVRWVE